MVADQIAARGISEPRVLGAFRAVPRDRFVPPTQRWSAYEDHPLPIGYDATISQPYIVALMTEQLHVSPTDRVLEIGAGSGYGAAILAELAAHVTTIETVPELVEMARSNLSAYGDRVDVVLGDGSMGYAPGAPYDAISVTAAGPSVPQPLLDQLGVDGRIVIPVDAGFGQDLIRITRRGDEMEREVITQVRFVPLVGEYGR